MKIIFYILAVCLSTSFLSCSTNDSNINDQSIDGKVKLKGVERNTRDGGGVGFVFEIGRKSQNCRRLGLCELVAFYIVIYRDNLDYDDNYVLADILGEGEEKYIQILLDEESSMVDTNLYVDEDILDDTTQDVIISAGIYAIDDTLGEYGGYTIPVNYN